MTTITVSLADLQVSDFNVRTNEEDANATSALEASIQHHGLLLPLVVHPLGDGRYGVLAGGRRLHAMQALRDRGALPVDHPVDVVVRDMMEAEIREASFAENFLRRDLRPYEVHAFYARAARDGASVEHLAASFGQTLLHVRQVLRLGNLAPPIFEAYARNELTDEQVQAYAATEDHTVQLSVWKLLRGQPHYNHTPASIRLKMNVGDREHGKLLRFVGRNVYEAAGGYFEPDLFQEAAEVGRVADVPLLTRLFHEKLEAMRAQITAIASRPIGFRPEQPKVGHGFVDHELQVFPNRTRLSTAVKERVDQIEKRLAELVEEARPHVEDEKAIPGHESDLARINAEFDPLEAELAQIEATRRLIFPRVGDIIAVIDIRDSGQAETTYWFTNRAQKKLADGRTPNSHSATAGGFREGVALNDAASPGEQRRADGILKEEHGLTQDGREIVRSLRRAMMRAMLVEDARSEKTKDVSLDYLVWSQLRLILDGHNARAGEIGAFAISAGWQDGGHDPAIAEPQLKETRARAVWDEALEELRGQSFIKSANLGGAFIDFQNAAPEIKRLAAAVVAGHSLKRSMNSDGYRISVHDVVANATVRSYPAAIRKLWHPTAAFLDLLPRAKRLEAVEEMVDPKIFRTWAKLKAAEVTDMVLRVLTGRSPSLKTKGVPAAAEWVHPTLQFGRPDVLDRSAPADDREAA